MLLFVKARIIPIINFQKRKKKKKKKDKKKKENPNLQS